MKALIEELLRLKCWSQQDLARETGMSESAVSRWRSGESTPVPLVQKTLRHWLAEAQAAQPVTAGERGSLFPPTPCASKTFWAEFESISFECGPLIELALPLTLDVPEANLPVATT